MIKDIKLAIFDMDGLLLDTEREYYRAAIKAFKKNSIIIDESVFLKSVGSVKIETEGLIKSNPSKDFRIDIFLDQVEEECAKEMIKNGVQKKKGVDELFDFLDKYNILKVVATSSSKKVAERLLNKADILSRLNNLICGDEVKRSKPQPDIFLKACEVTEIEEKYSIIFEDSMNGVLAANAAHIKCILVPDLVYPPKEIIDIVYAVAESLSDIPEILIQ